MPITGWIKSGRAFDRHLAQGELIRTLEIRNASGPVLTSEIEGDRPQGRLTSTSFKIERRFVTFRVGGGNYPGQTCLNLVIRGKVVRTATGRRSDYLSPVSWDVREYRGQTAKIEIVDEVSGDWGHINVDRLVQTDTPERHPVVKAPLYAEPARPLYHFTARYWDNETINPGMRQEGWINDLNGLIYYEGEYHLFAQRWNRCWLHAVSRDLVHWTELEPAFWEERQDSGVQSGTCVIDYDNTSGLAKDKANPAMIAFWSRNDNESQCIHYSLDKGRTWTAYDKNPILTFPERDPKVFWYAPGKHWVMVLYGSEQYHIFTSNNLLDWKNEHRPIPNSFECPDFFELPVDGNANEKKWVLIQGDGNYSIGTFDGRQFKEEVGRFPCDVGPNFYATQSWHNVETGDGRRIQAAWMRGSEFPDQSFSQQVSFPCELTLHRTPAGLRIYRQPVAEVASLQEHPRTFEPRTLASGEKLLLASTGEAFRLKAEVEIPDGAALILNVRGIPVKLTSRTLESGHAPAQTQQPIQSVEVLIDRASIEAFVNRGEISSTRFIQPKGEGISLQAEGGDVRIRSLTVSDLKGIWKPR